MLTSVLTAALAAGDTAGQVINLRKIFGSTYRGVPIPEAYRLAWGRELTAARAWRAGVDAALEARP